MVKRKERAERLFTDNALDALIVRGPVAWPHIALKAQIYILFPCIKYLQINILYYITRFSIQLLLTLHSSLGISKTGLTADMQSTIVSV